MSTEVVDGPVAESVAEEEPVQEAASAEAEADLAAGFSDEPGTMTTEPTSDSSPAIIDPNDAPAQVAEVEPQFVLTKAQHQELIESTAQLKAALGQLEGKAFGKMGELQRTLKQMQEATPSGQAVEISAEDFKELSEQFPEVAGMQIAGLNRVLGKMKGTGTAVDEGRIGALVDERLTKKKQEEVIETLDLVLDGWRETVHSPEYDAWLMTQPDDYQKKMADTWKPSDVKESINRFKAAQAAKPKPKAPATDPAELRRQRIEQAVVAPSAGGGGPKSKTATDELLDGFNS